MKSNLPKWAIVLCVVWLVSTILICFFGVASGSPDATNLLPWELGVAIVSVILLDRVLAMHLWALKATSFYAAIWAGYAWHGFIFGFVALLPYAIGNTIGTVVALKCARIKNAPEDIQPTKKLAARTANASGALIIAIAAIAFANSYRIASPTNHPTPARSQIVGSWYGTFPSALPKLHPVSLNFADDGTGNIKRLHDPHTYRFRWLTRGSCLHVSGYETGAVREMKLDVSISQDGYNLSLAPSLRGLAVLKREPISVAGVYDNE